MSGKRYPPEVIRWAREMHDSGVMGYKRIANELGVTRDTVRAWVNPHRASRSGARRKREAGDSRSGR